MPVRIITIPFDPDKELFSDEDLCRFLLNKRVLALHPEFFQARDRPYWTVFIEYETVVSQDEPQADHLNEAQRLLLQRLKEWRKEKAGTEGVPVFIVATNKQLMEVVRRAPGNLEALRAIQGFGKKKIERHGKQIIEIVTAFYKKRPLRDEKTKIETKSETATDNDEAGTAP
jgi:superfamily II DNA helicase RecQ